MDPSNQLEAFRGAESDIEEGADFLIVGSVKGEC